MLIVYDSDSCMVIVSYYIFVFSLFIPITQKDILVFDFEKDNCRRLQRESLKEEDSMCYFV